MGRADKLKALRAARAAGSSKDVYMEEEPQDIYDMVDEDDYRAKRRDDLLKDDFVIDDNGEGYVDTGADEWDGKGRHHYYSSEDEQMDQKPKKKQKVKKSAPINNFFKPSASVAMPAKKKVDAKFDDILDDFMAPAQKSKNLFNSSTTKATPLFNSTEKVNNRRDFFSIPKSTSKTPLVRKKIQNTSFDLDDDLSFDINETSFDNHMDDSPTRQRNMKSESPAAPSPAASSFELPTIEKEAPKPEPKKLDDDEEDSEEELVVVKRPRASAKNVNRSVNMNASARAEPKREEPKEELSLTSSPTSSYIPSSDKIDQNLVSDDSKSFKMYWLDYTEVENTLILFGKVLTTDKQLVSAMVQVKNFNRELFFLPRDYRLVDGEATDEAVTPSDVRDEIQPLILEQYGLTSLRTKEETRKYAFEMPGIPKEKDYLKILLPFQPPKNAKKTLPSDLEGETFSHVFGTSANIFETFVLQRNIMGPCWLEIKNANFDDVKNTSHCKLEVSVNNPNFVTPIEKSTPEFNIAPPPLTSCSISVQTMMNQKENRQEVIAVTLATYRNLPQDAPVDENLKPNDLITLTRPIAASFPPGLKAIADKNKLPLRVFNNEKPLLNCLAALVKLADPDVFIGHRLENISLDILLHRMHDLKVPTFSTFGRRQRKQWPDRFGKNNANTSFLVKEIFAGRLLCDISNEMGQSLTTKCQSWDLPEMYDVVCKKKHIPLEINWSNPQYTENANSLFMILKENCVNSLITAEIAFRMQILSLSKQLTNLAGNAWAHTLGGTRAGRNEFILLHEFNRNDYIVPDKETRQQRLAHQQQYQQQSSEDGNDEQVSNNNKKSKYQGGLVFEPEKGLHKNYILVMDFNSLYPSIIQEFNICFTTVDRDLNNIETLPDVPPTGSDQGVLPRLLSTLVNRRREVKKLMKDPTATMIEKAQYDIKQQALKLTANSMYGCLGYVNSRFYAKPLAMLVTNKGREILMDTRQLAESLGLRVVYGDTDSVMIDTNCDDIKDATKIGEDFKIKVNERYRLLEIDIDNVFKRLLLHAKKKYAAMNVSFDKMGQENSVLEVKGLDMKRREYCPLSKEISIYVLEKILSDLDPELALNEIYSYLEDMTSKIKNNEIRADKFKINTKLSKDPSSYPGAKNMPAVQVALRLREQGKVIKAGSVITFVITEGEEGSPAERARALAELLPKTSTLKPDANHYLEKQIFAPVERLLERIEGFDVVRLAKSLGLEHRSKQLSNRSNNTNGGINGILQPLESTISDAERFKLSKHLYLNCKCGSHFKFGGIVSSNDYQMTFNGIQCKKCMNQLNTLNVTSQLEQRIRSFISKYYQGIVICDDSTCGMITKQISVYGKRCLSNGCKGVMRYQYSDKELYNQLLYFDSLFDVEKNKNQSLRPLYESEDVTKPQELIKGQIDALSEQNRDNFNVCKSIVQKYLSDCGRRYVDLGSMFDFMQK
ncbi:DNA polymerase alpha subunit A [Wickerhamomyces ciferrii]|uniref:DNA polymerase n=1 Tax=Wickerhamomyces ciferrii (strain ATCC 14091 / BCRC 22168 / CBS 111 / JCM 3599 / NBRC 0793 / NRRL Y-1031 F-60-10) TaxID=1206466 RepID=K0KI68_WICCF|nr:DNA polymerase alpha subunit A [Wickerhamomyces ciferrii]CCH41857.1 DNA polymerase alpha subunit A [Wickerhamomyces ciferrii]